QRSWMSALTFRSKSTPRPITCTTRRTMKSDFAAVMATSTALPAGQALDQGERTRRVQVLMVLLVVHLEAGSGPTRRQALDLLERELPVGRALAVVDAEPRLERVQDVLRAAQRAGEVAAHLDVPAPLRLLPVHRVEGGDRAACRRALPCRRTTAAARARGRGGRCRRSPGRSRARRCRPRWRRRPRRAGPSAPR